MISDTAVSRARADAASPAIRLLALQVLALLIVGGETLCNTHIFWNPIRFRSGDVWHYYRTATQIMQGSLPYRDFPLEYPPLAVIPFLVPLLLAGGHPVGFTLYSSLLLAENIVLSVVFVLILDSTARLLLPRRDHALTWSVLLIVVMSPLLPWRYDLFPALLTLLALRSVLRRQPARVGVWLGLGIAAKLYPVVLLPVLAGYYWVQKDRRAVGRMLGGSLIAVAASALPFVAAGPKMLSFMQYHEHRGIEIESFPACAVFAAHLLWRMPVMVIFNYGADHLMSPLSTILLKLTPWMAAALLTITVLRSVSLMRADTARGGEVRHETLLICLTAMLLAFIATNKVFSPQYMIWFLPFVTLLPGRFVRPFAAVFVLTIIVFPFAFGSLQMGQIGSVGLLVFRNLLMAVLLAQMLFPKRPFSLSFRDADLPIIDGKKVLGEQP